METIGFLASIFIGIALGLIGGGGSILTVPVLVYLFGVDMVLATAYSLFIVGTTSIVGSVSYFRKGLVNLKTAFVFGLPSIVAVFLTRAYLLPSIPDEIFTFSDFVVSKNLFLILLFALLMIVASYSMIKENKQDNCKPNINTRFYTPLILLEGTVVGTLTGLVGAGGGFLIIPALVMLSKLPIKEAIGTSLVIIAAKSLIGFFAESGESSIDWVFLFKVTAFAMLGIFVGIALSKKIKSEKLKPVFGWFVLVIGLYILAKEILFK